MIYKRSLSNHSFLRDCWLTLTALLKPFAPIPWLHFCPFPPGLRCPRHVRSEAFLQDGLCRLKLLVSKNIVPGAVYTWSSCDFSQCYSVNEDDMYNWDPNETDFSAAAAFLIFEPKRTIRKISKLLYLRTQFRKQFRNNFSPRKKCYMAFLWADRWLHRWYEYRVGSRIKGRWEGGQKMMVSSSSPSGFYFYFLVCGCWGHIVLSRERISSELKGFDILLLMIRCSEERWEVGPHI